MPYMIETSDGPDRAELRARLRPEHISYLVANRHRLLAAGAKLSDDGASSHGTLYLLDTEDRQVAEDFLAGDPFMRGGLFARTTVTRWRKGFFDFAEDPEHKRNREALYGK